MDSHPSRSCGSSHDETDINITEPSILTNAHHFTINHAHFAASNGTDIVQVIHDFCKGYYEARSWEGQGNKSQVMLSIWMGLLQFLLRLVLSKFKVGGHLFEDLDQQDLPDIPKNALTLQANISFREGARFHSAIASYKVSKVKAVMVQIFEGPDARLLWKKTIVGISPSLDEDLHYIVFDGSYKRDTSQLIASLLREGNTREIMVVGSQIVYGIADFDIFSDDLGKTVVSFSPGKNQEERKDNNASIICNSLMSKERSSAALRMICKLKLKSTNLPLLIKLAKLLPRILMIMEKEEKVPAWSMGSNATFYRAIEAISTVSSYWNKKISVPPHNGLTVEYKDSWIQGSQDGNFSSSIIYVTNFRSRPLHYSAWQKLGSFFVGY
ncbi:hypothetical protein GG344DRAFT_70898 [Lentinula edodes]|nr:hypothetical protein GG344DRAFT_70898 [Lentinula edodes]